MWSCSLQAIAIFRIEKWVDLKNECTQIQSLMIPKDPKIIFPIKTLLFGADPSAVYCSAGAAKELGSPLPKAALSACGRAVAWQSALEMLVGNP